MKLKIYIRKWSKKIYELLSILSLFTWFLWLFTTCFFQGNINNSTKIWINECILKYTYPCWHFCQKWREISNCPHTYVIRHMKCTFRAGGKNSVSNEKGRSGSENISVFRRVILCHETNLNLVPTPALSTEATECEINSKSFHSIHAEFGHEPNWAPKSKVRIKKGRNYAAIPNCWRGTPPTNV